MSSRVSPLSRVARSRNLRRVGLGFLIFNVAEWGTWVAMLVYAYQQGGATASGVVGGVLLLPAGLAAPALSVLADRHPPAWSVLGGYLAQGTSMLALAAAITTDTPALVVYAIALIYAATFVVSRPAQAALLPLLTESPDELTATYVVAGWMETGALVAGPIIASALLASHGPGLVFAVFGVLSIASAFPILPLTRLRLASAEGVATAEPTTGMAAEIRAGLTVARTSRGLPCWWRSCSPGRWCWAGSTCSTFNSPSTTSAWEAPERAS